MKNNKGFAISSVVYAMLILFLGLILLILGNLASRKAMFDKEKNEILTRFNGNEDDSVICTLISGEGYDIGAKYVCKLEDGESRAFYVLETNGNRVSLIMDRNFIDDTVPKYVTWCIDGGSNNTTCKNITSKEEGTPLKHIQDTFGENVTVSFPTAIQIVTASGKTFNNTTVSGLVPWLSSNLTNDSIPIGYWTATFDSSNIENVWVVDSFKEIFSGNLEYGPSHYGVRPVITVSKSNLN